MRPSNNIVKTAVLLLAALVLPAQAVIPKRDCSRALARIGDDQRPWLGYRVPRNYWADPANRRSYLLWLEELLRIEEPEDWYRVNFRDFVRGGTTPLKSYWDGDPLQAARELYPNHIFYPWRRDSGAGAHFWAEKKNRLAYRDWLVRELGWKRPEDWYEITGPILRANFGSGIHQKSDSVIALAREFFPNFDFKDWLFASGPGNGFWSVESNRVACFQWLKATLGIEKPEDWYTVDYNAVRASRASGFLQQYGSSHQAMLAAMEPEYDWKPWRFATVPRNYWKSVEHRRKYLLWLESVLGIKTPEDWYRVRDDDFIAHDGEGLLRNYFEGSVLLAAREAHPEHAYYPWLFGAVKNGFWKIRENRLAYMAWLEEQLAIQDPGDWLRVREEDFIAHSGSGLIQTDGVGVPSLVAEYRSDTAHEPWEYRSVAPNFWANPDNQQRYVQWLGRKLGFTEPEHWYRLQAKDVYDNRGWGLLDKLDTSPRRVAQTRYPSFDFKPWLFSTQVSRAFWEQKENRIAYLRWFAERVGFEKPEDWYGASYQLFNQNEGATLVHTYYENLADAVRELYPDFVVDPTQFKVLKRQTEVWRALEKIFPGEKMEWNFKHPDLRFAASQRRMELDIFLPERNLAIEYQGEQHFKPIELFGGWDGFVLVQRRDHEKRAKTSGAGIRLVEVAYTWDGTLAELRALIAAAGETSVVLAP